MTHGNSVQGRRYVNGYLLSLDDTTLNARGYVREELGNNSPSVIVY
ncbi:conserved hypothetical protein [Roseibium sp. TrichSKD4]|nr:hypothetical protein [Roseibium sp. TrichSKD4]EFO28775.1 conserved hypothetical protein [Roseibium sp. TrichSKD4]